MAYMGVTPTDPDVDWPDNTPYDQYPPWLRPTMPMADLNPAAGPMRGGYNPYSGPDNPLTRSPYADEMYTPDVASTGVSGLGNSSQPPTDLQTGGPGRGAAQAISSPASPSGPSMPPPGTKTSTGPTPQGPPPIPNAVRSAPPGQANTAAVAPAPTPANVPPDAQSAPLPVNLNPQIQRDYDILSQPRPEMKKGAMSVIQRLGMALLSATKLAPYAQQIVHPIYSQEMAQRQAAEQELGKLSQAQAEMQRGQYYQGLEAGRVQTAKERAAGTEQAARTRALEQQMKTLLHGREDDAIYLPSGSPNIPKNYDTIQDLLNPGYIYAVPPAFQVLTPELQQAFPTLKGYQIGDPVPHSDIKAARDTASKIAVEQGKPASTSAEDQPLGSERVAQFNGLMNARYQILHPGKTLPPTYQLTPTATVRDYQNIERSLSGEEAANATQAQRAEADALRKQSLALVQQAAAAKDDKGDIATRQLGLKTFETANGSAERFNVMAANYEDALKGDQQAGLSLLANHLGMTMGLQKGARLNQAVINEAIKSRPWLQGLAAKWSKDGYLDGVVLTPQQANEMLSNARGRFSADVNKARSDAKYLQIGDDGPERLPNQSVVSYYVRAAGGNVVKAKQMLAADGWSVQ